MEEKEGFFDSLGGYHKEDQGWNPNKVFCGKCFRNTCKNCRYVNMLPWEEKKDYDDNDWAQYL